MEESTQETITVNFARTTALKYASVLGKGFRLSVPAAAQSDMRETAQRRAAFLLSLAPEVRRAYRRAERNACKVGYGVLHCRFMRGDNAPELRELNIQGSKQTIYEYSTAPGGSRSIYQFESVKPEDFFPIFTSYDDPNNHIYYVIQRERNKLTEEVREVYKVSLMDHDDWGELDPGHVEPRCTLLHYWDKGNFYVLARTTLKNPNSKAIEGIKQNGIVLLDSGEHKWGRVPYWIISNLDVDDEDPTFAGTVSDVEMVMELNRSYNQTLSEAATEIRIHIHRPLVYSSDEPQQDPDKIAFEPNAVIPIGLEEKLEGLNWQPMPDMAASLIDRYKKDMDHQSFLNEASYGNMQGRATGAAMRLAQASMEQMLDLKIPSRVDALQNLFGSVLAFTERLLAPVSIPNTSGTNVGPETAGAPNAPTTESPAVPGRMLFRAGGKQNFVIADLRASDIAGDYTTVVEFNQALPYDKTQMEQNEVFKFKSHVQDLRQTLLNMGTEDVDAAIDAIKADLTDKVLFPDVAMALAQLNQLQGAGSQAAPSAPASAPVQPAASSSPLPMGLPRNTAPTVPSDMATPGGANVPDMGRSAAVSGPSGPGNMPALPIGPGINKGPNG